MQRVSVIGVTGAGKTTFAASLAATLQVPHVELDALHWEPNWTMAELDVFRYGMARRRTIVLAAEQHAELIWHRDHDPHPYVRERCAAVVQIAAGATPYGVARHGLLKRREPDTVYGWLDSYQRQGLAGLMARQRGGVRRRHLQPAGSPDRAAAPRARRGSAAGRRRRP